MNTIGPHEPLEELPTFDEAFADAQRSEENWLAFDTEHGMKRVFIELPTPLYHTLERLAHQQRKNVLMFIERVIEDLVTTFGASAIE